MEKLEAQKETQREKAGEKERKTKIERDEEKHTQRKKKMERLRGVKRDK